MKCPLPLDAAELPMLDVYMPMMRSAAIIAAGKLGLFHALADGARDAAALAARVDANERGVTALADFLVSIGYLEGDAGSYANSPHAQRWFTRQGQVDYSPGLDWTAEAWTIMEDLPNAIRRGGPAMTLWDRMLERPQLGSSFSSYMHAFACHLTTDLLERLDWPQGARRLLDLGGSHGIHSISFCERHPELTAVIADLESALTHTEKLIIDKALSDRVTLLPGDLNDSDWGTGYDVVFYLSVAHNQSPAENRAIFEKIGRALRPGGMVVVHEYLKGAPNPSFHAAFELTLLTETGTGIHSYADISSWLTAAGFGAIERIDLSPADKGSLVIARR